VTPRRYVIELAAACPGSLREMVATRFDLRAAGEPTVLVVDEVDQAALRALLILLWDTGQQLAAVYADQRGG
jgi:hypothetical protein